MKVYWAAPLFNPAERFYNLERANQLRKAGHVVILPQEHHGFSVERMTIRGKSARTRAGIFKSNLRLLQEAEAVVAVLNGTDVDSGTAVEASLAYALGKPVIGLREDFRKYSSLEDVNLMVEGICNWGVYRDINAVKRCLAVGRVTAKEASSVLTAPL